MNDKILVTYATRTGSTKEISTFIGVTLCELGEQVDVIPMQDVTDLSAYKAVIAGSAIQANMWLPEAIDFINTYKNEFPQKPLAVFLVCLTLAMSKGEAYRTTVSGWLEPVRNLVSPVSEGLFKGVLDIKKIPSFGDRLKFRISVWFNVWKEGDHRDWNAIQDWTISTKSIFDNALK